MVAFFEPNKINHLVGSKSKCKNLDTEKGKKRCVGNSIFYCCGRQRVCSLFDPAMISIFLRTDRQMLLRPWDPGSVSQWLCYFLYLQKSKSVMKLTDSLITFEKIPVILGNMTSFLTRDDFLVS